MAARDTFLSPADSADDRRLTAIISMFTKVAQAAHEHGVSPVELIECMTAALAHIATVSDRQTVAAGLMESWAADLRKGLGVETNVKAGHA